MSNGREANGRWKKGYAPNPRGSSRRARQQRLNVQEVIGADTNFPDVWKKLVELAKEGRAWAIKLYLSYRAGLPVQAVEIEDRKDIGEKYVTDLDRVYGNGEESENGELPTESD